MSWNYRNTPPKSKTKTWKKNPKEGQRVNIQYAGRVKKAIWDGTKFINDNGNEIHNIVAWKN